MTALHLQEPSARSCRLRLQRTPDISQLYITENSSWLSSDTFCAKRRGRMQPAWPCAKEAGLVRCLRAAHDRPGLETKQASSKGQGDVVHQFHPMAFQFTCHAGCSPRNTLRLKRPRPQDSGQICVFFCQKMLLKPNLSQQALKRRCFANGLEWVSLGSLCLQEVFWLRRIPDLGAAHGLVPHTKPKLRLQRQVWNGTIRLLLNSWSCQNSQKTPSTGIMLVVQLWAHT